MDHHLIRVVHALCEDVATPRALAVKLLADSGEWTQLLKLRVRPHDYADSESYWKDALVTELLRKCQITTEVDREGAAVATFYACERRNAATNARLTRFIPEDAFVEHPGDERVMRFIDAWRKDVDFVLGTLPTHLTPRFSGGATYGDAGSLTTTPDKMSSTPTITSSARDLLCFWQETSWFRTLCEDRPWQSDPLTVRGNKFFTVPKDAEKHRGCCKEPSINISFQLDVGRLMKTRLRRIGIDLKTGQDLHRVLAQKASLNGELATIDMSNASDTLCRVLPRLVLRKEWFTLLDSLRATHTLMFGRRRKTDQPLPGVPDSNCDHWVRLEKFSSMGNGFTFELESLIFATLARRVVADEGGDPDLVKCYGDDLIVPVEHTKSVLAALAFFGFEPNNRKTFSEGPFRESCGGDFFGGVPVRAHYLEEIPDEPQKWISLANGLRRVAFANDNSSPRWDIVRRAWLRVLDAIPSDVRRCRGPEHLGDAVIHDVESRWGHTEIRPRRRTTACRGFVLDDGSGPAVEAVYAYLPVPIVLPWHHWLPTVQLASCTLGLSSTGVTPRGSISGYKISRLPSRLTCDWEPRGR